MPDTEQIHVVTSCRTEPEAAIVVAVLAEAGIDAQMTGAVTSSFRAEAPGEVRVLVPGSLADRADRILAESRRRPVTGEPDAYEPANRLLWLITAHLLLALFLLGLVTLLQ